MKQISPNIFAVLLFATLSTRAVTTNAAPDFKEVYDLLRANLPGATDAELNQAAVQGLVAGLRGRAMLVANVSKPAPVMSAPLVSKSTILDGGVAYVRVARVADGLANAVSEAAQHLATSNKLKGVVLDLRFAEGDDYAAAAATADLFLAKTRRLLDWGNGMVESKAKKDALISPVAVLVNGETDGAAEALAAVLRKTGAGLVLGSRTAGRAAVMREFPLKNGERLRVAATAVKLADGSALSPDGLKPDIEVKVKAADEGIYFADAYANLGKTNRLASASGMLTNQADGTNPPARRRVNEADLVRARREGRDAEPDTAAEDREPGPERAVLRDPVLARALDLLQGLALVRTTRAE